MIVDTRTLTTKINETQLNNIETFPTKEDKNTNSFEKERSHVLVERSRPSRSCSEFSLGVIDTLATSTSSPRVTATKNSLAYNNHSTFKPPIDIVSAAFADAELDQFEPDIGNF